MRPGAQFDAPSQLHGGRPAGAQLQRRLRIRVCGPVPQAREAPIGPCEPDAGVQRRVEAVVPPPFEQARRPSGRVLDARGDLALMM